MLRIIQKVLKKEKGFTLVELLATVVILGIIAGIAVPMVGGLIENSKKDAHIANARQFIEAARLYILAEEEPVSSSGTEITLSELLEAGYIANLPETPGNEGDYSRTGTRVVVTEQEIDANTSIKYRYEVTLVDNATTAHTYLVLTKEKDLDTATVHLGD